MRFARPLTAVSVIALTSLALPFVGTAPADASTCGPLSCEATMPPPVIDATAGTPVGVDDQKETTSTTAEFTVAPGDPEDVKASYECRLEYVGGAVIQDWTDCTVDTDPDPAANKVDNIGSYTRAGLAVGTSADPKHYQFSVRTTIVGGLLDNTTLTSAPTLFDWYIVEGEPGGEEGAPRTIISSAPSRWLTQNWFSVDISASEAVDHYNCTLDGHVKPCGTNSGTKKRFDYFGTGPGDHIITVQAVDKDLIVDPTPATARFSVPKSAIWMSGLHGFKKATGSGPMLDQYVYATKKGAYIVKGFSAVREVVVVVSKAKGLGTLKVYIGNNLVKRIHEDSTNKLYRQVIRVKRFKHLHKGPLRIVAASGKKVIVEAVGLSRF